MGMDMELHPMTKRWYDNFDAPLVTTTLRLERSEWTYNIREAAVRSPKPIEFYTDTGCQVCSEYPCGGPVQCMTAEELLKVPRGEDELHRENKAAIAYIAHLLPDSIVVLWVH